MTFWFLPIEFASAAFLTWLINWLSLIPFRRARAMHWTERARRLYPARVAAGSYPWIFAVSAGVAQPLFSSKVPPWFLTGPLVWFGAVVGTYPSQREIYPNLSLRKWIHEMLAGWVVRLTWLGLIITIAVAMPEEFDWRMPLLVLALVISASVWTHGGLMWLLKVVRLITIPGERLVKIVREASTRMGVPEPRTFILRSVVFNAFALIHGKTLLFTNSLLEVMTDEEISAICFHELGHLQETKTDLAFRSIGTKFLYPLVFIKPVHHMAGDWLLAIAILLLAAFLMVIFGKRISRKLEVKADSVATSNEPEAGVYAHALERLYENNRMPAVMPQKRTTHPNLYDRLIAAGVQPDYPRPRPPSPVSIPYVIFLICLVLLISWRLNVPM